eukprot:855708-Alexandrium_andersonii.AAC.1
MRKVASAASHQSLGFVRAPAGRATGREPHSQCARSPGWAGGRAPPNPPVGRPTRGRSRHPINPDVLLGGVLFPVGPAS